MGITAITAISILIRVFDPFAIAIAAVGGWWARSWWQIVAIGVGAECVVDLALLAARPDYSVPPVEFAIGAAAASGWAFLAQAIAKSPQTRLRMASLQRTKAYDLLAALPLIAWYVYGLEKQSASTWRHLTELLRGDIDLLGFLQLVALLTGFLLGLLIIVLLLVRRVPELKSKGALPRIVAVCGTFLATGFLRLEAATLSLPLQVLADVLLVAGAAGAITALARLRTSFSMMPEARRLVTSGPYAVIRHPLYAAELVGFSGLALQFQQPWATLLLVVVAGLQYWRTVFEEAVLSEAYPDYANYRMRTWRFVPYVF